MTPSPPLFNQRRVAAHQLRALRIGRHDAEFLTERAGDDIAARVGATNRQFSRGVDLFSFSPVAAELVAGSGRVEFVARYETSAVCAAMNAGDRQRIVVKPADRSVLPIDADGIDFAMSVFGLHWCDDVPGMLVQIRRALAADGLFMGTLLGDGTLAELRDSLMQAELELTGGASARVDPFIDVRQAGALVMRAGFALPVADAETVSARYPSMSALIADLRAMGATSALTQPGKAPHRRLFERAEQIYRDQYGDDEGRVRATFNLVHVAGWAPDASQQKPLKPGSATHSLSEALGSEKTKR